MSHRVSLAASLALCLAACPPSTTNGSSSSSGGSVCRSSGESCADSLDCCSGFECSDGLCAFTGSGPGGNTGSSSGHSSTNQASNSSSSSSGSNCGQVGGACANNTQCCSGLLCTSQGCQICAIQGTSCQTAATCCDQLACVGGVCGGAASSSSGSSGSSSSGSNSSSSGSSSGCGVLGCNNSSSSSSSSGNVSSSSSSGSTPQSSSSGSSSSSSSSSSGSSSGGVVVGSSCTIDLSTVYPGETGDPCFVSGLACLDYTSLSGSDDVGTCQLPIEFDGCSTTVGCAQSPVAYSCVTLQGSTASFTSCLQSCTATTSCNDIADVCADVGSTTDYCYYNFCGPGSSLYTGTTDNGTLFYGPCTVVSGDDGYCYPLPNGAAPIGLCSPIGTAGTNASCTSDRPSAGTGTFCIAGDTCETSLTVATDQGYCNPLCAATAVSLDGGAAAGGGPACPGSEICVQTGYYWGTCGASCNPNSSTCTAPDSTCYGLTGSDGGVCAP
jgi:hypothetical protein